MNIREVDLVVGSSAVPRLQKCVVLEGAIGSENCFTIGRRKRKYFELASDSENL